MRIPDLFLSARIIFSKLGSGKKTHAAQVAIRLAKKNRKFQINIVRERGLQPEDFGSMQSAILVIHDQLKNGSHLNILLRSCVVYYKFVRIKKKIPIL